MLCLAGSVCASRFNAQESNDDKERLEIAGLQGSLGRILKEQRLMNTIQEFLAGKNAANEEILSEKDVTESENEKDSGSDSTKEAMEENSSLESELAAIESGKYLEIHMQTLITSRHYYNYSLYHRYT